MAFRDTFVSREGRYTLGIDDSTGALFFSTPISGANRAVEWESYYVIDESEYATFLDDVEAGAQFADDCRMGRRNDRLTGSATS